MTSLASTNDLPVLNDAERQELEQLAGRPLSNDEAQLFRREMVLDAAIEDWIEARLVALEKTL